MKIKEEYLKLKPNNRFVVEFPSEFEIKEYLVQKINKPKFIGGKWNDIRIDFIDLMEPSTSKGLFKIVEFLQKNNNKENETLFVIKINSLDPTGVVVEEFLIQVEDVLTIDFGELDYGSDQLLNPFMILKPFKCEIKFS